MTEPLDSTPLLVGSLDEEGKAVFELPVDQLPDPSSGGWKRVAVVLEAPGYCLRPSFPFLHLTDDELSDGKVLAMPGQTARGRVIGPDGEPCPAQVAWSSDGEVPTSFSTGGLRPGARSYPDGSFELDLPSEVLEARRPIDVFLDVGPAGTGVYSGLPLALCLDPSNPLTLQVSGPGVLRGRVLDGSSQPSVGLEIVAQVPGLEPERVLADASAGALRRSVRTDSDGQFVLHGLAAAAFELRWNSMYGEPVLLTPEPVLANGEPVELVHAHTSLVVRSATNDSLAASSYDAPSAWPAERTLLLWPATGADSDWSPHERHPLHWEPFENGGLFEPSLYQLDSVAALLIGGDRPVQSRTIALVPGANAAMAFDEVPSVGLGTATFQLSSTVGKLDSLNHRLWIEPLEFPFPIALASPKYPSEAEIRLQLPEGRYRAVLEDIAAIDSHHATVFTGRETGRSELEFEVAADSTLPYSIEARPGGLLEVTCRGQFDATDREAVLAGEGWFRPRSDDPADIEAFVLERAGQVRLVLHHHDRAPEPLYFLQRMMQGSSADGIHAWPELPLNETRTAEMVPAGDYDLVAELPGGRTVTQRISVGEGETLPIEIDFE